MAANAPAAEPEGQDTLEQDGATGQGLPPETENPSSMARCALRRQAPEVGTGCLNWARPGLCGGRGAILVPTAIISLLNDLVSSRGSSGIGDLSVSTGAALRSKSR